MTVRESKILDNEALEEVADFVKTQVVRALTKEGPDADYYLVVKRV